MSMTHNDWVARENAHLSTIASLRDANKALTESRDFWKTEYLNASHDAAKFANDLVAAEAKLAKVEVLLRDDDQTVEALAKIMHDRSDDDGCSVPWGKQSPRYRSQQRRLVRKVLVSLRASSKEASQ